MGAIITKNEKETQKIATNFAKQLRGGEVILMYGDLGAGKTVFVKALAKALGVREVVKSPTFNIMKCYRISVDGRRSTVDSQLCHIDAYRLKSFDDLLDIGADEYIGRPNVITVIEWAERIEEKLRIKNYELRIIKIKIEHGEEDEERIININ